MGKTDPTELDEELTPLLEEGLDPAWQERLAQDDELRDLRHELRAVASQLGGAGKDFVLPSDLEARVLAALDARQTKGEEAAQGSRPTPFLGSAMPAPAAAPGVDGGRSSGEQPVTAAPVKGPEATPEEVPAAPVGTPAPAVSSAPVAQPTQPMAQVVALPPATQQPAPAPVAAPRRGGRLAGLVGLGVAAALAAAAPFYFLAHRGEGEQEPRESPPTASRSGLWSARVHTVARASGEGAGGLEARAPGATGFAAVAVGAAIVPGSELRTDARTRARVDLDDGTQVVLDRATTLRLDGARPRTAQLVTGALVAEVAHLDRGPEARIGLPQGEVRVLGTKFALTALDERSTVRVTRGVVQLAARDGSLAEVKTGQEGVLARGARPEVSPAVNLAGAVGWSELGGDLRPETDVPVVGLGELRARRPGQRDERDHAVHLASHSVRVRIVGNVARTEIEEVFRNDSPNELEGIYRFPLPPEGQIERLALDVHGQMEAGAFVDRARAQAIWRGVLQNAQHTVTQRIETPELVWVPGPWRDPALLEWQRGGRFELRIFPIPANGSRRVSLSYTQVIPPSGGLRRYVYPLPHDANNSTRVDQFDVDVQVLGADASAGVRARGYGLATDNTGAPEGATRMTFSQAAFVPAGDLVLEYALPDRGAGATAWAFRPSASAPPTPAPAPAAAARTTAGAPSSAAPPPAAAPAAATEAGFVALALRPALPRWTESRPRDYALVMDTSRSMVGERLVRASRLVRGMVAEMDPRDRFTVLACDTTCRALTGGLRFAGADAVRAVEQFTAQQDAHGASDLVAQVRAAVQALPEAADRDARVVYLGDGAPSAGWRLPDAVGQEVAASLSRPRATLTAVALGTDADATVLGALARAGGGVVVPYVPGETLQAAALGALEATYGVTLRDPVLTLPAGLTEVSPSRLPTLRAGGELLVAARMAGEEVRGEAVLRGTVGGEPFEARFPLSVHATSNAGNAFVPRLFAAARIAELEATRGETARAEVVALSQRFQVASRYTSLLVLEGDAMYRAFGVRRNEAGAFAWTGEERAQTETITTVPQQPSLDTASLAELSRQLTPVEAPAGGASPDPGRVTQAAREDGNEGEEPDAPSGAQPTLGVAASASAMDALSNRGARRAASLGDEAGGADMDMSAAQRSGFAAGGLRGSVGGGSIGGGGGGGAPAGGAGEAAPAAPTPAAGGRMGPMSLGHASAAAVATRSPARPRASNNQNMEPVQQQPAREQRARDRVSPQPTFAPPPNSVRMGGQWMRRTWVLRGNVDAASVRGEDSARVTLARTQLQLMPDSKTRHQELYRWLSVTGSFAEATQVAERWSSRDALDPDALVRLSDMAAREGQRERAIRILEGTADVRSEDPAVLRRLAELHERAGNGQRACAFRVSLAQVRPADVDAVAAAVRCERAQGHGASATRLLDAVTDASVRARMETAAGQTPAEAQPRGALVLTLRSEAAAELDVAVIDNRGNRISWMGGRASGLVVRDATNPRLETLSLSRLGAGDYTIEVSRAQTGSNTATGALDVQALSARRSFSVRLAPNENTQRVGRVTITREEQLVPL